MNSFTPNSLEAMWSIEFGSNLGAVGAGVAVFETDHIYGGDGAYKYVGNYHVDNGFVYADIAVTRHSHVMPQMQSVFGPISKFHLKLHGPLNSEKLVLNGAMTENPALKLTVNAQRVEELPNSS